MLTDHRAYATIPSANLSKAKTWYKEKLGLSPVSEDENGAIYHVGGGTGFLLYPTPNAGKAPNTLMSFGSTDVVADVKDLKKHGVVFEEYDMPGLKTVNSIASMGRFHAAWFRDADGNILAIGDEPN